MILLDLLILAFIFITLICFLILFYPVRLTVKQATGVWMLFIFTLASLGFLVEPSPELDLYRMYIEIDEFRDGSRKIFDSPLFAMNIIYWLVSHTNNNGWLVFGTVVVWGLCIREILKQYLRNNTYNSKAVILYFFAANAGCFVVYLISGIRSTLTAAIWCYAYFIWYDRKQWIYYLLVLSSVFIHVFGLILLGLTFLYYFLQRKKSMSAYLITFFIIMVIGYILNNSSSLPFLSSAGIRYVDFVLDKIRVYSIRGYEFQQTREFLHRIMNGGFLLICLLHLHRKGEMKYEIFGFFILVMFAGYNMSILFERMPYVLGICTLPIINASVLTSKKIGKLVFISLGTVVFGLQLLWGVYETSIWINFVS